MNSLNTLIQTMENMVEAHTRLLELATKKRALLVDEDIQGLQKLVLQESTYTSKIQELEQQRQQIVQDYMAQQGITGQSFTLEDLLNVQKDPSIKATIQSISKQLLNLIKKITSLNESNQLLIHTSLSYIQYSLGMLVQKEPGFGYGPNSKKRYSNYLDAKI